MIPILEVFDLGVAGIKFTWCFLYPAFLSCLILANFSHGDNEENEDEPQEFSEKLLSGLQFIIHYWVWYGILSQLERLANITGAYTLPHYILLVNPLLTLFNIWLLYNRGCVLLDRGYLTKCLQRAFNLKRANFHDFDVAYINPILSLIISRHNSLLVFVLDCWIIFFNQRHRKSVPNRLKKFIYKAPEEMTRIDYIAAKVCYVDDHDYKFRFSQICISSSHVLKKEAKRKKLLPLKLNLDELPSMPLVIPDSGISPRDIRFMDFPSLNSPLSTPPTREGLIEDLIADTADTKMNDKVKELTDITINNLLHGPTSDDSSLPENIKYPAESSSEKLDYTVLPFEDDPPLNFVFDFNSDNEADLETRLKTPLRLILKLRSSTKSRRNSNEYNITEKPNEVKEKFRSKFKRRLSRGNKDVPTPQAQSFLSLPPSPNLESHFVGRILRQPLAQVATSKLDQPHRFETTLQALALTPSLPTQYRINEASFRRNIHRINPNANLPPKYALSQNGEFNLLNNTSPSSHQSKETPYPTEEYLF